MRKKIIIFGSLLVVFFMLVTPSIPAVQNQVLNTSTKEKIIETIKNEDYKELKELLIQLIDNIKEPSNRVLHLRTQLEELDNEWDDNEKIKTRTTFLNLLSLGIGITLIIIGAFTMYFGSGKARAYGTIIAVAGILLIII